MRDKPYHENYNFLKNAYKEKNEKELMVVELILEAICLLGDIPSSNLEIIEKNILFFSIFHHIDQLEVCKNNDLNIFLLGADYTKYFHNFDFL